MENQFRQGSMNGGLISGGGLSAPSRPKSSVRQFRSGDPMDQAECHKTWNSLKKAISQIHAHNASSLSFEELYRNAYNLVLHKYGDFLYEGVKTTVTDHLKDSVALAVIHASDENLLEELKSQWEGFKTTMGMIRDILMYLDRNYVAQQSKKTLVKGPVYPVYEMGLIAFRDEVSEKIKDRLLKIMLEQVGAERRGEGIDRILFKHTVQMMVELGVYRSCFEDQFVQDAREFYEYESTKYISENPCPTYLIKAQKRIQEERNRVESYLHEDTTMQRIMSLMDAEWILRHYTTLIDKSDSGCRAMLTKDKKEDLNRLYLLLGRCPETLKSVHRVFSDCIKEAGTAILNEKKEPVSFIHAILGLREKYCGFVRDSFQDSKEFHITLKTSFEEFLNKDTQTAQYLSLFVDDLFRKGAKGSDREIETALDQVVTIFRYLQDKDIFESFYKQYFAKRLLSGKQGEEAERCMISKLKSECGHQYTAKLEGMFNDIRSSEDLTRAFHSVSTPQQLGVELKLSILTSGYWPTNNPGPCNIPLQLKQSLSVFEEYYMNKHQGRRLTWNFSQGFADLRAKMPGNPKRHELVVSTYQMCILLCLNDQQSLSFQDLRTKIPNLDELKRHLQSLYANPKCKILIKQSTGGNPNESSSTTSSTKKEPQDGDVFMVNPNFESKMVRVKVPLIRGTDPACPNPQSDGVPNSSDMPSSVEEDRKHLTEAVIVRIMKSRKTLEHNNLIIEVTRHLSNRFAPTPGLIKQRIERLIEREYLERDPDDRKVYNYLA